MSDALQIGVEQRDLTRQYLEMQNSRVASEDQEVNRGIRDTNAENAGAERSRTEVSSSRASMLQQSESLRSKATNALERGTQCQSKADDLLRLLRHRGKVSASQLTPDSLRQNLGDPERALSQHVRIADESLQDLESAVRELAQSESSTAGLRLILASIVLALIAGVLVHLWGWTLACAVFPVLVAVSLAAFRLDHGVALTDSLMSYAARKRAEHSAKPWYSVPRSYFSGLTAIRDSTDSITNPYIQSGTRAAATLYLTGSSAGVVVAASYAIVMVIVTVVVIGVVFWIIAKMLENA